MLTLADVTAAAARLAPVITQTPLHYSTRLSEKYQAHIYLKREDLQIVRSYKLRGAYACISNLPKKSRLRGVVCASAGNHAQGVAYSCKLLNIPGIIFMPENTPRQKVQRVKDLGNSHVTIYLTGDTYDSTAMAAKQFCQENSLTYIHPFDDYAVIAGQATVAQEALEQLNKPLDFFVGQLAAVGSWEVVVLS